MPYTKESETRPPNQRPLSAWKGLRFLLMFPDDPRQVSVELAEQLLGLRLRPLLHYLPPRPRPPVGADWLDYSYGGTWCSIGGSVQACRDPQFLRRPQAWVGRSVDPKAIGRASARLGVQVSGNPKADNAATGRSDGALFLNYTPTGVRTMPLLLGVDVDFLGSTLRI